MPDGTVKEEVQLIRDPEQVRRYIQEQEEKRKRAALEKPKAPVVRKTQAALLTTDDTALLAERKEKRRQQEAARRKRPPQEDISPTSPRFRASASSSSIEQKCTACGQTGHMRTNRLCPVNVKRQALMRSDAPAPSDGSQKLTIPIPRSTLLSSTMVSSSTIAANATAVSFSRELLQAKPPNPTRVTLKLSTKGIQLSSLSSSSLSSSSSSSSLSGRALDPTGKRQRRRRSPEVELCSLIEQAVQRMRDDPTSEPFRKPVTQSIAPNYFDIIKEPMDLFTIGEKLKMSAYTRLEEFYEDIQLIIANCFTYCPKYFPRLLVSGEMFWKRSLHILHDLETEFKALSKELSEDEEVQRSLILTINVPKDDSPPLVPSETCRAQLIRSMDKRQRTSGAHSANATASAEQQQPSQPLAEHEGSDHQSHDQHAELGVLSPLPSAESLGDLYEDEDDEDEPVLEDEYDEHSIAEEGNSSLVSDASATDRTIDADESEEAILDDSEEVIDEVVDDDDDDADEPILGEASPEHENWRRH